MPAKMSQAKPGTSVGDPDHVGDVGAFGVEGVAGGAVLEGRLVAGVLRMVAQHIFSGFSNLFVLQGQ